MIYNRQFKHAHAAMMKCDKCGRELLSQATRMTMFTSGLDLEPRQEPTIEHARSSARSLRISAGSMCWWTSSAIATATIAPTASCCRQRQNDKHTLKPRPMRGIVSVSDRHRCQTLDLDPVGPASESSGNPKEPLMSSLASPAMRRQDVARPMFRSAFGRLRRTATAKPAVFRPSVSVSSRPGAWPEISLHATSWLKLTFVCRRHGRPDSFAGQTMTCHLMTFSRKVISDCSPRPNDSTHPGIA